LEDGAKKTQKEAEEKTMQAAPIENGE